MKTVHKFPLFIVDRQEVMASAHFHPLFVAEQHGKLCLWAEIDDDAPKMRHAIYIRGTGYAVPPQGKKYIGSVLMGAGTFVWHVWLGTD